MGILDMLPKPNHNFKFNAVVTPKDEMEKLSIIFELQKLGYDAEYMNWRNNINGRNIVVRVGLWHCTDSDSYKSSNDFINCESDIDKFLDIASQKVINK